MDKEEYKNIFDNENSFWWYRILDDLAEYFVTIYCPQKSLKILDAGCGTGRMMTKLSKYGDVSGIDASPDAVEMCKSRGLSNVNVTDLNEWSPTKKFNLIVSLDVLYHESIQNIDKILGSFNKALNPEGILILNLPAFKFLAREHDIVVKTKERFRARETKNLLVKNGFHIQRMTYRHPLLFIYILLRKLFPIGKRQTHSDLTKLYGPFNTLLILFHQFENEMIKMGFSIPFGSSLFVVARKLENNQDSVHGQVYGKNGFIFKLKAYTKSKTILNQAFKYSLVGILNTIIGLGVIYLLYNYFSIDYILSNVGGYACGLVNSFFWNKKWTFKSSKHYSEEIIPFLIVFGISYAANLITVILSVEYLKIHPNISQIVGIAAYSITNFLINRSWTFSKVH